MKTEEGNKLIAEFMGMGQVGTNNLLYAIIVNGKAKGYYHPEKMLYHDSWDWLMPVVKKIGEVETYSPIHMIWEDCVEFIQWYKK